MHTIIHTLGPTGTNCHKAAVHWLKLNYLQSSEVVLHKTLEEAVDTILSLDTGLLLSCIVYPDLHKIVFGNLSRMRISDCFVMPTHNMVIAHPLGRRLAKGASIASHAAPAHLAQALGYVVVDSTSNTQAADDCASGKAEGCVTTYAKAVEQGFDVAIELGEIPMGFAIHTLN